jgi:hypothetical protein
MSIRRATVFAVAAFAASTAIAMAQAPSVSFSGCVQKESSVLKRNPVAADIGMDDEFVLTFARPVPPPGAPEAPQPDVAPAPAGTSGSAAEFGTVYRLTGDKEKELKSYVGQRVEVTGTFKAKEKITDAMSSIGTSGKNDPQPSNTAEITIDAIKPASGSCAPVIK